MFFGMTLALAQAFSPTGTIILYADNNNGQFSLPTSEDQLSWDIYTETYPAPSPKPYTFYTVAFFDSQDNFLEEVPFDQKDVIQFPTEEGQLENKVLITAPFDPSIRKVVFKNDNGQSVGQADINPLYFCNFNTICESQIGENSNTCSVDCQPSPTYIPVTNTSPSPSMTPPPSRSKWKIFLPLVIWFGLAIAVGVGWFIIKKRIRPY